MGQKRMHGQLPCNLDEKLVDKKSFQLLKFGDINGETESTIVAAGNQYELLKNSEM
jgi:hypothetical protein